MPPNHAKNTTPSPRIIEQNKPDEKNACKIEQKSCPTYTTTPAHEKAAHTTNCQIAVRRPPAGEGQTLVTDALL